MRKPYKYTKEIHGRLLEARQRIGLSQRAMAKELGYTSTYFSKVETNEKYYISEHLVVSICNAFGISFDYLAFGEGEMFVNDAQTRAMNAVFERLPRMHQYYVLKFAEYLAATECPGEASQKNP